MTSTLHPSVFSLPHTPLPSNSHPSATLAEQAETEDLIEALLATTAPLDGPKPTTLRRGEHNVYLGQTLFKLPGAYAALDASKPWLIFWTVQSLDLLAIALDAEIKKRAISTLTHFLHPQGGFSGGPSNTQIPHLLPTYASTCSLAIVGHDGEDGGWQALAANRQTTYDFFMRCKKPNGGFVVSEGGEVDVRGTYCLLVVATLLDILTPELLHNVDKFIAGCQTYEGGFACATYPFASGESPAQAEAHGGYTSCALLAHFLLSSVKSAQQPSPSLEETYPRPIDVDGALRWSVLMQGEAIEAGGFRGRSNKLVDGCYSWWVGGGVPVLEELARRQSEAKGKSAEVRKMPLFNNVALQEFVLLAAQKETGSSGGLRDKPGKRPDLYHTCNNLSGLSIAQHHMAHQPLLVEMNRRKFDSSKGLPAVKPTTPGGGWKSEEERQAVRREVWSNALGWDQVGEDQILGGQVNFVNATTPVFNILPHRLKSFIDFFYGQSA